MSDKTKTKRDSAKEFEIINMLVDERRVEEAVDENIDAWRTRFMRQREGSDAK